MQIAKRAGDMGVPGLGESDSHLLVFAVLAVDAHGDLSAAHKAVRALG